MTEMVKTFINDRWPLLLPKHRADRPEWYYWEAGRLASMWHYLGRNWPGMTPSTKHDLDHSRSGFDLFPREVVYDIGSEEGDFPALFSSWGCDVVLFEPNDRVWPNIKAIWEANDLRPPLACVPGFAGPQPHGDIVVKTGGKWPESADGPVIGDHGFCNLSERPDIPSVTIDEMVAAFDTPPPTAITIDVEGAEWHVLVGAKNVMKEHRPKIWVSVHPDFARTMYHDNDVTQSIQLMMQERGYDQGSFIAYDHEAHWLWLPVEHPSAVPW